GALQEREHRGHLQLREPVPGRSEGKARRGGAWVKGARCPGARSPRRWLADDAFRIVPGGRAREGERLEQPLAVPLHVAIELSAPLSTGSTQNCTSMSNPVVGTKRIWSSSGSPCSV